MQFEEDKGKSMNKWKFQFANLTIATLLTFGGLSTLLIMIGHDEKQSNLPLILFLCGACGAAVNNYRRLSLISDQSEKLDKALSNPMVTVQFYVSPVVGGIFALLLWSAFFSGLIKGTFFPQIEGTDETYTNFHNLMATTHPASFADATKGVVWSFLAGYSERFVPNILDRLVDETKKTQ